MTYCLINKEKLIFGMFEPKHLKHRHMIYVFADYDHWYKHFSRSYKKSYFGGRMGAIRSTETYKQYGVSLDGFDDDTWVMVL